VSNEDMNQEPNRTNIYHSRNASYQYQSFLQSSTSQYLLANNNHKEDQVKSHQK